MNETNGTVGIPRLNEMAEFRFQLRSFLSFSEVVSEANGIAPQQYQLIQVIGSLAPDQDASISFLAERMILRHNSTVELVDRAEKAGLVRRKNDERDLRRSLVHLTETGREILERVVVQHIRELETRGDSLIAALRKAQGVNGEDHLQQG